MQNNENFGIKIERAFEQAAEKLLQFWKPIAAVIGVLIVTAIAYAGFHEWKARQDRVAFDALFESQVSSRAFVAQKKYEEAEQAFAPVIQKHKGTRAAYEAELQIGDLWMDVGNYEKAAAHYEAAANSAPDPFSRLLANYDIGIAKETAGKPADAVAAYETALNVPGSDSLRAEIMMAQARCYEAMNQAQKAIDLYKTIAEKFSNRAYYSGAASAYEKMLSTK